MNGLIDSFQGEYEFLSNFYPSPITYEGVEYPTVEHAFQAAKTTDNTLRRVISRLSTPGKAKRAGRSLQLRSGWDDLRLQVMSTLVELKFQDPELRRKLIGTGSARLIEGNHWHDIFWGVCEGKGENNLGKILMSTRTKIYIYPQPSN